MDMQGNKIIKKKNETNNMFSTSIIIKIKMKEKANKWL